MTHHQQVESTERAAVGEWGQMRSVIFRYCTGLTGSRWDAEDLTQDTFLKMLPVLQGNEGHPSPVAFALRIAKNKWTDQRRRQHMSKGKVELLANEMQLNSCSSDKVMDIELAVALLLQRVQPLQRTVFLLREVLGYSTMEVASMLKRTEGAIKSLLNRARLVVRSIREDDPEFVLQAVCLQELEDKQMLKAYVSAIMEEDAQRLLSLIQDELVSQTYAASQVRVSPTAGGYRAVPQTDDATRLLMAA
ncbi:RNA polymerase sigma factor [Paenibacillus sp. ACRRX]|uniref:RNA polymerase sigma factor n=1 Tax=Paenibacillus sp. ACRRX TaxID=2918206 RepID=UPI001EF6969F|nr:RNA polymerase sigma factor [Paenibacillus sp. ACRRX]MCG7407289.1 RNA polymerase sigma factor [Paenibacillus sp. ACRRX]